MKFEYKSHAYIIKAKKTFIFTLLAVSILTYFDIRPLNLIIGALGIAVILFLGWFNSYREGFIFLIEKNFFRIVYKNNTFDLLWQDIAYITENDKHIIIKANRDNIQFPIYSNMDEFSVFKNLIIKKAQEFNIKYTIEETFDK